MQIYNKQPKPKLRARIEFTERGELVRFIDMLTMAKNELPLIEHRRMAEEMVNQLRETYPGWT